MNELRRRSFVGRDEEIARFRAALGRPGVIFFHGAGGVGKSMLLDVLADLAAQEGFPTVRADGRHLAVPSTLPPIEPAGDGPTVLFIDTYERMAPIDDWVREEYLPSLPADTLIVISGRQGPGARWRADPAWRELLTHTTLNNLTPDQGRTYLRTQGVAEHLHDRLVSISHAHPLTLSMLVDAVRQGAEPRTLADLPDLVGVLLAQTVETAPSPRHREALEVCAHDDITTEEQLRGVLGDDVGELFAWLRALPFIMEGPHGLYPHDLIRDVLDADLRWRDPGRYADLHRRLRSRLARRVRALGDEREQLRLLTETIVVAGPRHPVVKEVPPPAPTGQYVDRLGPKDQDAILAMTTSWQGTEQADLVKHWMVRDPSAFRVFRGTSGQPDGYAACLTLTEDALGVDPGADAMFAYVQSQAPARDGEQIRAWRFFVDREHGQGASASLTLFTACQVLDILTRPEAAWTLNSAHADLAAWSPVMAFLDFWHAQDADFAIDGTGYCVFAHDWRRSGPDEWLDLLSAREVGEPARPAEEVAGEPVLSQAEFTEAVRAALRDSRVPRRLAENPLARSQAARRYAPQQQAPEQTLRDLLGTAAAALPDDLRQIVERTFFQPLASQERVAEALHLSFSTYRRHRDRAVAQIAEWLWEKETGLPIAQDRRMS